MSKITGMQVKAVIDSYISNNSILETAKATGVSTVKVRKILITEGLWESDTSIKIGELLKQGMTTEEIANTLYMSIKNVQAYMPYERGVYGGEEPSKEAIRSDKYRNRMKKAASMQVLKTKDRDTIIRQFKNGDIKRLFTHPKLLGKGLTFVNCTYNIYYSLSFSYEEFRQSQDRIHRIGQDNKCTYIILQGKNTIDEKIYNCLKRKGNAVDELYMEMGLKNGE